LKLQLSFSLQIFALLYVEVERNESSETVSGDEDFGLVELRPLDQCLLDGYMHVVDLILKVEKIVLVSINETCEFKIHV
jgi:hypothetical protein